MKQILKILGAVVFFSSLVLLSTPSQAQTSRGKPFKRVRGAANATKVSKSFRQANSGQIRSQATKKIKIEPVPNNKYTELGGNKQTYLPGNNTKPKSTIKKKPDIEKENSTAKNRTKQPEINTAKKGEGASKSTRQKGKKEKGASGFQITRGPPLISEVSNIVPSPGSSIAYNGNQLSRFKYASDHGVLKYNAMQTRLKNKVKLDKLSYDEVGVYSTKKMQLDVPQHGGIILTHKEYDAHMKPIIDTWKPKKKTKSNYRHNLCELTKEAGGGKDAHHVFPQKGKIARKIKAAEIDIHDPKYMTWWKKNEHRSLAKQYNQEWEKFFEKDRTKQQILTFGRRQNEKYTLQSNF